MIRCVARAARHASSANAPKTDCVKCHKARSEFEPRNGRDVEAAVKKAARCQHSRGGRLGRGVSGCPLCRRCMNKGGIQLVEDFAGFLPQRTFKGRGTSTANHDVSTLCTRILGVHCGTQCAQDTVVHRCEQRSFHVRTWVNSVPSVPRVPSMP
jgi:hypothetical protein